MRPTTPDCVTPEFFYTRYKRPPCVGVTCPTESPTQQNFAQECDINLIVKRAMSAGDMTMFTPSERADFFDCTQIGDFQAAQDLIVQVRNDFSSLSSDVRRYFGDNALEYVEFMLNPANAEQAVEMGLLETAEPTANPLLSDSAVVPPVGDLASNATETD